MKIMLILVDGMRPDALTNIATAQKIIAEGKSTMSATTVVPSITLPCHMSLFHSVDPARHGTTTNTYTPPAQPVKGICGHLTKNKKTAKERVLHCLNYKCFFLIWIWGFFLGEILR